MPVLLYLLALAVFAQGTSEFVIAGLLPEVSHDLDVSLSTAGLLTSAFALGMVVGAPLMAALGRRHSPRLTLPGFLICFIAAHVVGALTHDFGVLLATRIIAALANAGFLSIALSTVARMVEPGRVARALSVILGGTTLALIAGAPAGAFVGSVFGWRATFWVIAAICIPALIAVVIATPARAGSAAGAPPGSRLRQELTVLRTGPVQFNLWLAVVVNAATFCSFTYLAVVATDRAGFSASNVPMLLAVFGIGAFGGVTIAGRAADTHWALLIGIGAPVLTLGWIVFGVTSSHPAAVWIFAFVQGIASFALGSTAIARVVASAHAAPTMGGSFATAALNLGAIIGPVAGGIALSAWGNTGPLWASAGFAGAAVLLSAHHRITERTPQR